MNVLLVYGTPVRRSVLLQARQELGVGPTDTTDVICWAMPEDDVDDLVGTVVVVRPDPAAQRRAAERAAAAAVTVPPNETAAATVAPTGAAEDPAATVAPSGLGDDGLGIDDDADDEPQPTRHDHVAKLPRWHPLRLGHGIGWRWRRFKRRLRPLTRRMRRLRWLTAKHPGAVFWRAMHGRAGVSTLVERADVIIAMDNVASLACWHVARTAPGTPAVLGLSEGRRQLARVRSAGQVRA